MDLPRQYQALTPEQAADILWDVLCKDIRIGLALFLCQMSGTTSHAAGAAIVCNYFDINESAIKDRLELLSDFAAVFADDGIHINIYKRICWLINDYIKRNPTTM